LYTKLGFLFSKILDYCRFVHKTRLFISQDIRLLSFCTQNSAFYIPRY